MISPMNCLCPYCNNVSEVPDIYRGKKVKCANCKRNFEAQLYIPQPIIVPSRILPATGNLVTKLWNKCPPVYRASFLATLGVISAIFVAFQFLPYWPKHRSLGPMESISLKLEKVKLFLTEKIPQKGIIRGRTLNYYEFRRDATRDNSYLQVWVDDRDYPIAVSAYWVGTYFGSAAETVEDPMEYMCSDSVIDGFRDIVGCKPFHISYEEANTVSGSKIRWRQHEKWQLDVRRKTISGEGKLSDVCKSLLKFEAMVNDFDPNKIPYDVYSYIAVAKTW
jgi:hypothetical protein